MGFAEVDHLRFDEAIRLRLLKIAAPIRITTRKVWISLASSYPLQTIFAHAWGRLRG